MITKFISAALASCLLPVPVPAQSLNQDLPPLARQINALLLARGHKHIAALDFTDLQGRPTELGRYLSQRIVVELVLSGGVTVADRTHIKDILAEHKLTEEGLVNPANAKQLGEFAGVDAILSGSISEVNSGWELLIKATSTSSASIVAAGRIAFPKTSDNQIAGNRSVPASVGVSNASPDGAGDRRTPEYEESRGIASKDIGALRVVLRSVRPIRLVDRYGRSTQGMRVTFDFINLETQRPIVVAANAEPFIPQISETPIHLRSSLLDDRGVMWRLRSMSGLGSIRAGYYGSQSFGGVKAHSATDIVRLLALRDKLDRDIDDPSDGYRAAYDGRWVPNRGNPFIFGAPVSIEPGRSMPVVMDFESDGGSAPSAVQISAELVIGAPSAGAGKSYSLQNVIFDRVTVPSR